MVNKFRFKKCPTDVVCLTTLEIVNKIKLKRFSAIEIMTIAFNREFIVPLPVIRYYNYTKPYNAIMQTVPSLNISHVSKP